MYHQLSNTFFESAKEWMFVLDEAIFG